MKTESKKGKLTKGKPGLLGPNAKLAAKPKHQRAEGKQKSTHTSKAPELLYRNLFENMLNGFAYCEMIYEQGLPVDFIYLDVNNSFESLTGLKDVVGKKVSEVITGIRNTDPELFEIYGRVAQSGKPERFESYVEALKMWFLISVYSPKKEHFVAVFDVITERKQAEEAREHLAAIVEASDDAIIGKTLGGLITSWNSGAQRLYGYSLNEVIGKPISLLIPPDRPNELPDILSRIKHGESVEHYETIRLRKDGTHVNVSITVSPIKDTSGQVIGASSIGRDITERKHAEFELRKAHEELELQVQLRTAALSQANMLLQTLLDNMPDQIYFKDSKSRFIKNSRAQAEALGLSDPSQIVGKTDFDFFPHAQRSFTEEQEIIRSGKPLVDFEELVVWPNGHETWVSTSKVPLRDPQDKIIGTLGISRDITERKRNEDALRNARDELEAFSYSVSHDLRAPLRGIDGWSLALLEDYSDKLDEQGKEYINRVRSEAQHMGELIDALLQLSRITRSEMHIQPVDLSAAARSIAARLQENEPQRHVEFIIQEGLSAKGDARLLEIALTNLLGNAFKFTSKLPNAQIEFGQNMIDKQRIFFIRDNGAGFDMAFAKKLFGAFQRMHTASEFPGTGIGLTTVQRIIHSHGGRIWAESVVDEGATFFFTIEEKI
jgi:PAS domain S-box-containing protein